MTSAATANHASNGGAARVPEPATGVQRVLSADGSLSAGASPLEDDRAAALHEAIARGRLAAEEASRLGAEGRIGIAPRGEGRQVAATAAAFALREGDWLFGEGREHGAVLHRGLPLRRWADQLFGNADDLAKGRQTPGSFTGRGARVASVSAPLGTHLIHAVGLAWGAKIRGEDVASLAVFDQAAVASSDFHNALNFAGVFAVNTVFLCLGDGTAIEGADLDLGAAYGVAHVRCDGDDPLAVHAAVAEAIARGAAGGGPTLVEAIRDGVAPADDRLARYLEGRGRLDAERQRAIERTLRGEIGEAIEAAGRVAPPPRTTMLDDVFAELPGHLRAQRRELER